MDLQEYRKEFDRIDAELIRLFARRMELSAQVAAYKKERAIKTLDISREVELFAGIEEKTPAELAGFGTALYASILALSRARQERLAGTAPGSILLIGMPGSGKKTVARALAERLGRPFLGSDALIETLTGLPIPEIFRRYGEDTFRALETRALAQLCPQSGCVIAVGGGCVTCPENWPLLRLAGTIVWVRRDVDALETKGRPLSLTRDLREMEAERAPLYRQLADAAVDNDGSVEQAAERIFALV